MVLPKMNPIRGRPKTVKQRLYGSNHDLRACLLYYKDNIVILLLLALECAFSCSFVYNVFQGHTISDLAKFTFHSSLVDLWIICLFRVLILLIYYTLVIQDHSPNFARWVTYGRHILNALVLISLYYLAIKLIMFNKRTIFTKWHIVTYAAYLVSLLLSHVSTKLLKRLAVENYEMVVSMAGSMDGQEEEQEYTAIRVMPRLMGMISKDWVLLLFSTTLVITASILSSYMPVLIGNLVTHLVINNLLKVKFYLGRLSICAFASIATVSLRGAMFLIAQNRLKRRLRGTLFRHILTQEVSYFESFTSGRLGSMVMTDVEVVIDAVGNHFNQACRTAVSFVVTLVLMMRISWRLSMVSMLGIPILTLLTHRFGRIARRFQKMTQTELATFSKHCSNVFGNIRTVFAYSGIEFEQTNASRITARLYALGLKQAALYFIRISLWVSIDYLIPLCTISYCILSGDTKLNDGLDRKHLFSFFLLQQQLTYNTDGLANVITSLARSVGAAENIFAALDRESMKPQPIPDRPLNILRKQAEQDIVFENVAFAYPERIDTPILRNFNLRIPGNKVTAIIGPSGAGKTTVMSMIQNFHAPSCGSIKIGDTPISAYNKRNGVYGDIIAAVTETPALFPCSIADNIRYNKPDIDAELICNAAKLAGASDFIEDLPDGYQTICGEHGGYLSGGQKQKIKIARALVRDPKILLLDEAMTSLDPYAEHLMEKTLDRIKANRTVVIVAHRLNTIKNADKIVVMHEGCVLEEGNHMNLMANENSYYRAMVNRQVKHVNRRLARSHHQTETSCEDDLYTIAGTRRRFQGSDDDSEDENMLND